MARGFHLRIQNPKSKIPLRAFLTILLVAWFVRDALPVLRLEGRPPADAPFLWGARLLMLAVVVLFVIVVRAAWGRRRLETT